MKIALKASTTELRLKLLVIISVLLLIQPSSLWKHTAAAVGQSKQVVGGRGNPTSKKSRLKRTPVPPRPLPVAATPGVKPTSRPTPKAAKQESSRMAQATAKSKAAALTIEANSMGERGDHDGALRVATEAIRLDSQNSRAYNQRGIAYIFKGYYDLAISDLTEAIRLDPQFAIAYSNLGFVYEKKGQFNLAISEYTEAIRLDPRNAATYANRGTAYLNNGFYDQALGDFTEAIRLGPKNATSYTMRASAYEKLGMADRAAADRQKAKELSRTN